MCGEKVGHAKTGKSTNQSPPFLTRYRRISKPEHQKHTYGNDIKRFKCSPFVALENTKHLTAEFKYVKYKWDEKAATDIMHMRI